MHRSVLVYDGYRTENAFSFEVLPAIYSMMMQLNSCWPTDILQYRLRFGSSLLYKSVFHLNLLTAQLSYEGRAAVEGGK
jgi:hypothetical protein